MSTIRIALKKGEKLHIEKPENMRLLLSDKRKHPTDFRLHMENGTIIRRSEIMNPTYQRINEQAEKEQFKGLSQEELSAVLNVIAKKGLLGKELQDASKEPAQKPNEQLLKGYITEPPKVKPKPTVPQKRTPSSFLNGKSITIMTRDYERLSKLPKDELYSELKKTNAPYLRGKEQVILEPLISKLEGED